MRRLSRLWGMLIGRRVMTAEERAACAVIGRDLACVPFKVLSPYRDAQIARFSLLAEGCKRHPAYRAIRQPRTSCSRCADMWGASRAMKEKPE